MNPQTARKRYVVVEELHLSELEYLVEKLLTEGLRTIGRRGDVYKQQFPSR